MSETKTYEPDAYYTMRVSRPVSVGRFKYLPRDTTRAKGALINRIIEEHGTDAIASVSD